MTTAQIQYILTQKGFGTKVNEWTALLSVDNNIGLFNLTSDANILVNPSSVQFYFDVKNELLYTRKYYGKPTTVKDDIHTIPVSVNDTIYYFIPADNQFESPEIGYFSDCISISNICAVYDKYHSCYNNY